MSSGAGFRAVRRHSRKRPILIDHNQDTLHTHTLELTTSGSQLGEKGDARYTSKVRVRHPPKTHARARLSQPNSPEREVYVSRRLSALATRRQRADQCALIR